MNRKRLTVLALLVFCCVGLVFAQGLKAQMEAKGEMIVLSPNGYYIDKTAVVAPAPVAEPAPVAVPSVEKKVTYSLCGYNFVFLLDGNTVALKYIDIYSEAGIEFMANLMMENISGSVSYCNPLPGTLEVTAKGNVAEAEFDALVAKIEDIIYHDFY